MLWRMTVTSQLSDAVKLCEFKISANSITSRRGVVMASSAFLRRKKFRRLGEEGGFGGL